LPQANICPTKTEAIDAALKDAERYDVKPCFPIGTSVVNCHGGLSDIDQIGVGGWVLSRNEKTGEQAYRRITRKFEHYKENRPDAPDFPLYGICYIAETGEAGGVSATPEHPFWVNGLGWVPASKLKPGQKLEICDPVALNDDYRPEGLKTEDFTLDGENWQAVVVSIEDARDDFGYRLKYLTGTGESFSKYLKADHPFLVEGLGWVQASELKPGQILKNSKSAGEPGGPSRSGKRWQATITLVEKRSRGTGVVYNIEVEEFHTYFVGHHGIWVHNECQGTHGCN
jgi:hypothetical protein